MLIFQIEIIIFQGLLDTSEYQNMHDILSALIVLFHSIFPLAVSRPNAVNWLMIYKKQLPIVW